jgi:hypothetical protein
VQYLTSQQVLVRYGGRHRTWLFRRRHDGSGFPDPAMRIAGQPYWRVSDLDAYDASLRQVEGKRPGNPDPEPPTRKRMKLKAQS